jgi:hypothetical protein
MSSLLAASSAPVESKRTTLLLVAIGVVLSVLVFCPATASAGLVPAQHGLRHEAESNGFEERRLLSELSEPSFDELLDEDESPLDAGRGGGSDGLDFHANNSDDSAFTSDLSALLPQFSASEKPEVKQEQETCQAPKSAEDETGAHHETVSMLTLFVAGVLTKLMSRFLAAEQLIWVAAS